MSYEFYKVAHITGLLLTVFGLFGFASVLWNESPPKESLRKLWMASHGIGLLFLFIAGFGLLARLNLTGYLPAWAYAKMGIWLLVGGMPALIKRKPQQAGLWLGLVLVLTLGAVILAVFKPF